ncbi:MAG: DUF2130 domain-containing protein [Clostridiales bacterium]|nr:DUF2130 domain-containing protein [Clostridiales bacterium]
MNEIKCPKCGTMFQIDEKDYDSIVKQIRDGEFNAEIKRREEELRKYTKSEIDSLKERLDFEKKSELSNKELEIERLKNQIRQSEIENKYALKEAVQEKENKIVNLENKIELSQKEYQLKEQNLIDIHAREIKAKEQEIELYKDMKLKLSTKMVGETLEQHCKVQYDEYLRPILKNAYFEKDNDAKTGSKGDFIYREKTDDGIEFISIMFEMKNESDQTATKHKNEDFFKELDKDRKEKNCEYAILVSLLEKDNDYYNGGIVDVSHKYEKMYVVRPQSFITIINILRNSALNTVETKRKLIEIQNQNIDIANFEEKMNNFKSAFSRNFKLASDKFDSAIDEIDKTMQHLQKIKDNLLGSKNQLRLANDKAEDLTIKKLTSNSPSIAKQIEDNKKRKKNG